MSDYHTHVSILRGEMADLLSTNAEQFAFVITNAFTDVDIGEAIELGEMGDEANPREAIENLRKLADAIEAGEIT